ncbi:MAG: prepilin peptidase [Ruminococcus sp.]|jgi:leader peptidase (prepilin peptidase)/N-methyltransferase|nr:prepilin peptidase [Ruminococcus sp.]
MSPSTVEMVANLIIYIFIFAAGAVIGSFLNVCILRLPRGESLVKQNSHCMTCGAYIKHYDLIPIFSWLILRGKCRNCGAKISPRYMLIETLTAVLFTCVFIKYDTAAYGFLFPMFACLFLAAVIVVCFEDLDTKSMSISVLLWMGAFAIGETLTALFARQSGYIESVTRISLTDRIIGMFAVSVPLLLIGFVITPLIYVYVISDDHKERRKLLKRLSSNLAPYDENRVKSALAKVDERIKEQGPVYGFGMGDVVLMAAAGLMLGVKAVVTAAFIGIVLGGIYGIIIKSKGEKAEETAEPIESAPIASELSDSAPALPTSSSPASDRFAFGPFLGIGIVTAVYVGNAVWDWYFSLLG